MRLLPATTTVNVLDPAYGLNLKPGQTISFYQTDTGLADFTIPANGEITVRGVCPFERQVVAPFFKNTPEKCPCGTGGTSSFTAGAADEIFVSPVDPTGEPVGVYSIAVFNGEFYVPDIAGNWTLRTDSNSALEIGVGPALPPDATTYRYFRLDSVSPIRTYHWSTNTPTIGTWVQIG